MDSWFDAGADEPVGHGGPVRTGDGVASHVFLAGHMANLSAMETISPPFYGESRLVHAGKGRSSPIEASRLSRHGHDYMEF
jgi:hypothetical protein